MTMLPIDRDWKNAYVTGYQDALKDVLRINAACKPLADLQMFIDNIKGDWRNGELPPEFVPRP